MINLGDQSTLYRHEGAGMSQSRVFNLVRDGVVVGNVFLAADRVTLDPDFEEVELYDKDGSTLFGTLSLNGDVTLQEITQPVAEEK